MSKAGYALKDIYVGTEDGKTEASVRKDFERLFYNFDNLLGRIQEPLVFLVSGRKGTGKTYFAQYLHRTWSGSTSFCEPVSFADFQIATLSTLKTDEPSPNEYSAIWEWYFLVVLAKQIARDNGILDLEAKNDIDNFVKENFDEIALGSYQILEKTVSQNIQGNFKFINAALTNTTKYVPGSFLNYLESLRTTVLRALSSSGSRHTILMDDLDDKFNNTSVFRGSLVSLIKAARKLNFAMHDNGAKAKIVIFIRSDVLNVLNDADLNKISLSNGFEIDWGDRVFKDAPVFQMVFRKIRQTVKALSSYSDVELYDELFPRIIDGVPSESYILDRTLLRPRDVVHMLSLIIKQYGNASRFDEAAFKAVEKKYAQYFLKEIKNELFGYVDDPMQIDEGISLLKHFGKRRFKFADIAGFCKNNEKSYPRLKEKLEETFGLFFRAGLIGSIWLPQHTKKEFTSWGYREYLNRQDLSKEILMNRGVFKELAP